MFESDNPIYAENCGCGNHQEDKDKQDIYDIKSIFPDKVEYGNGYVPYQQPIEQLYCPEDALLSGTIFPELDQPYQKRRVKRG